MISIDKKENCCGCFSCKNICPPKCIQMCEDNEGFVYPIVDVDECINCHLCENRCPILEPNRFSRTPAKIYGCRNKQDVNLLKASSGGMFELLAKQIIREKGVVFGAKFDKNWNVVHAYTETIEGIIDFIGSKYVQSTIGDIYVLARNFLQNGRKILFVGAPCQIAGLYSFLGKQYDNLITIDFVCHGVPSPKVWREYLNGIKGALHGSILYVNFRDKESGWPNYSFSYISGYVNKANIKYSELGSRNPYMRGFLHDLYLRPSCHNCKFKHFSSMSDITLSDFWGVWKTHPKWDDQKGASCVAIHTAKGLSLFESINENSYVKIDVTFQQAYIDYNNAALHSAPYNSKRDIFFLELGRSNFINLVLKFSKDPLKLKIKNSIHSFIRGMKIYHLIKK